MESSGAGAHVALATPTPVPQPLNDQPNNTIDFDNVDWMAVDEPANMQEPTLLQSPFNDRFVSNPFQASNVRESIDETAASGAQQPDQPVVAPADFSMATQDEPILADATPALPLDASMDTNNLESVPMSQDAEPFNFDDNTWGQPPYVPETSQAVSESEHPDVSEMNGFAQLSFQDGDFLVTSTQVILGRDDKFAKKYHQEQKLAKRRLKEGSRQAKEFEAQEALHEYQQEPSHPSAHGEDPSPDASLLEGRPARGLASAYSEQGGIVGLPEEEKRRRRNKKKRRHPFLSGQSSSTTSVAPANLHTFKYDVSPGPDDGDEDAQKPVFLPVHPNNPADIKLISREHLQIEFNGDNSRWELKILGRSAYVKNEHYFVNVDGADSWEDCEPKLMERDEVAVLTHLTEIIVASLRMQFRLPKNTKVVSTFDSDDSDLSDALSSPTRPTTMGAEGGASDSSDEDDAPLQSIKLKKQKKQKKDEKAKGGKKPVMLNLKKRKDSETSPVKAPPVTPKQAEKGKKPKKTVPAGSEPAPTPVAQEKKEPPQQLPQQQGQQQQQQQPMQLHLPPAPTQAQLDEQAQDHATAMALQAATYKPAFESAPSETPASANSGAMMYTPQQPAEPVTFEPGSMLSEVPSDQLPEKRKGPGRPPKNGLISKRDMGIIRRKQKEFEKQGIPVPPLDELVRIVRAENKAKEAAAKAAARGEAPPPMTQNYPVMQSIEMSQEPSNQPTYVPAVPQPVQTTVGEGEYVPADPENKGSPKRQRTYRSPSPMKSKEECTEEELKKPNHTYYTTLDEILSEGPPEGLELQQIYDKICKKYPYYKYGVDGHGWQSSVRHNLKQHERFQQVTKQGKGWLWAINQDIPFDKEKKRKPTPPPVQRPPMPYPMNNGMAPQQGMQQYGNPYGYGQTMHNGQTYQQPAAQPGQQYAQPYNQNGQQPYTQPGAPQQQYVPAGSQPPANQQYQYAPQQQQPQQPPYQPNGAPPAPVPARRTPDQRQGSGTPHPQPGFNNLVDEIMAYRSDYLRPYAHLQSTPLYKEQEDVFKKCVEWISELQCNGTPQLNFSNDQERRVFGDLERIMRKYQNPAPTSAPATGAAAQPASGDATNPPGAAQPSGTTVNGPVNTPTASATDTNTSGVKRNAPDNEAGDGSESKRMKVEGEGDQSGVSMATPQAVMATSDQTAPHQVTQTAEMTGQAPAFDSMASQPAEQSTEPVFDFSNPSGPHDDHTFDFSTPDNPGEQSAQPVFDFSQPDMPTIEAPAEQPSQLYTPAPAVQPPPQDFSQQTSNVSTPQPPPQQSYQQSASQTPNPAVAPSPSQPPQTYSQQPTQAHSGVQASQPPPQAQPLQAYSQPPLQPPSAVTTAQPPQVYSQPPSQAPPSTVPAPRPTQVYSQPPSQPATSAPTPQPAQTYSQPPAQPQNSVPTAQPAQSYAQASSQTPSNAPTPQPSQAHQQGPSQPPSNGGTTQQSQSYQQAPQPPNTVFTPQPAQQYQPPQQPANSGPAPQPAQQHPPPQRPVSSGTPQPAQTYSQPPSRPTSAAQTPQPGQQYQLPSQPASAAPTPQPTQHYQPPSQPQSHPSTPQPAQQPASQHVTPSHTSAATPSMTPFSVEQAVESILPVATSGQNTPTGTGGHNTPAPQS